MQRVAFVVMQVGAEESAERRRADEVTDFVLQPVLESDEFGIQLVRSDQDATPGTITQKMLSDLVGADVVVADLTGRNPNVYYELGIAHAFQKIVITLGPDSGLPFDVQNERTIPLPPAGEKLGALEAQRAKERLTTALRIVLAEGYEATSPLSDIANRRSLDALASSDPVAEQLAALRTTVDDVREGLLTELRAVRSEVDREEIKKERDVAIRRAASDGSLMESMVLAMQSNPEAFSRFLQEAMAAVEPARYPADLMESFMTAAMNTRVSEGHVVVERDSWSERDEGNGGGTRPYRATGRRSSTGACHVDRRLAVAREGDGPAVPVGTSADPVPPCLRQPGQTTATTTVLRTAPPAAATPHHTRAPPCVRNRLYDADQPMKSTSWEHEPPHRNAPN